MSVETISGTIFSTCWAITPIAPPSNACLAPIDLLFLILGCSGFHVNLTPSIFLVVDNIFSSLVILSLSLLSDGAP